MSYKVNGTNITLTRGDTFSATLTLYQGDQEYVPQEGDSIRFAVKHPTMTAGQQDYSDVEPVILKQIDTQTMTLILDPEDTSDLGFGNYVYDIEITFSDGSGDTFITASKFVLTPEVH